MFMIDNDVYSSDLLDMRLCDVSDLFLEKLCESDKKCVKADIPGCNRKTDERFVLRVCLCYGDSDGTD